MTKKTCPVCEKTVTNLKKHLARKFKCKPPKEISKEISEEIIVDVLEDKQPEPMKEEESEEDLEKSETDSESKMENKLNQSNKDNGLSYNNMDSSQKLDGNLSSDDNKLDKLDELDENINNMNLSVNKIEDKSVESQSSIFF